MNHPLLPKCIFWFLCNPSANAQMLTWRWLYTHTPVERSSTGREAVFFICRIRQSLHSRNVGGCTNLRLSEVRVLVECWLLCLCVCRWLHLVAVPGVASPKHTLGNRSARRRTSSALIANFIYVLISFGWWPARAPTGWRSEAGVEEETECTATEAALCVKGPPSRPTCAVWLVAHL